MHVRKMIARNPETAYFASDAPLTRLGVAHGNAVDVDQMVALLADIKVEHPVVVANMGSVVGAHGGPGIIGLGWIRA